MSGLRRLLLRNVGELVTCDPDLGLGPLGIVRGAAVLCEEGRILYAGPEEGLPAPDGAEPLTLDIDGCVAMPGLIDCHTHLVYAGDRLGDFEARLGGSTYSTLSRSGGGILSTVRATRAASDELLLDLCESRAEAAAVHGVTTIEVKSGYGLDLRHELRLLRTISECDKRSIPDLVPTFLGAHSFPVEARRSDAARQAYVDTVVYQMLPLVAEQGLARFCDIYIDDGVFTVEEGRKILECAKGLGLGLKVHAEQMSHTGAASLAAELGAVSAEHLEHATPEDLRALADAGVVAVLLPGASFFLRDGFADASSFRDAGVRMALATDCNPGTSPTVNLPLMAQMGVLGCNMTIEEAILGITTHAATALGLQDDRGMLRAGMRADLALLRCRDSREIVYRLGASLCSGLIKDGEYHRVESPRPAAARRVH
jgi:imidazolonepropionase